MRIKRSGYLWPWKFDGQWTIEKDLIEWDTLELSFSTIRQLGSSWGYYPPTRFHLVLVDEKIWKAKCWAEITHQFQPVSFAAGVSGPEKMTLQLPVVFLFSISCRFQNSCGSNGEVGHYTSVLQQHAACRHLSRGPIAGRARPAWGRSTSTQIWHIFPYSLAFWKPYFF